MKKSVSRLGISALLLVSLLFSCICSGCFFISREPDEPPEYLFKDDLDEFKAFLEDDPEIVQYDIRCGRDSEHIQLFEVTEYHGYGYIEAQIDNVAWEHVDEIARDRVMPRITREVLLGLEEDIYHRNNWQVRLETLKVSFYVFKEGSSLEVMDRITFSSDDDLGFNSWSIDECLCRRILSYNSRQIMSFSSR